MGQREFPAGHPFRAVRATPDDRPLPPIYILGSTDYGARLAAEMGVGYAFAGHFSPDPPEPPMRAYRAEFSTSGVLDKPHAILALSVHCADTEEAARRMASSVLLSFVQLRSGRPGRLPSPEEAMAHVFTPEERRIAAFYKSSRSWARPSRSAPASRPLPREPGPTK